MIGKILYYFFTPPFVKKIDKNGGGIYDWTYISFLPWCYFLNGVQLTKEEYQEFLAMKDCGKIIESDEVVWCNELSTRGNIRERSYPIYKVAL